MKLLEKKSVKIVGKEYPIKMSIRAMIDFEKTSGHSISEIKSIEDITTFFYCMVKAGGTDITYDQFMDLIDDSPESLTAFSEIIGKVEVGKKQKPI